jgi:hypothetical protein
LFNSLFKAVDLEPDVQMKIEENLMTSKALNKFKRSSMLNPEGERQVV